MARTSEQKVHVEREDSNTINSLHLTNIHKTTYPTIAESTFL